MPVKYGTMSWRWAFVLIALNGALLIAIAIMRGGHPPGHDELNFLETGIRMLGTKGNPGNFIHGSFMFDVMTALHGVAYVLRGIIGHEWDPGGYLEHYVAHKDQYLFMGRLIVVMFSILLLCTVYSLSKVLYDESAALLAVALLSFGVILPLTGTSLKEDLPASALALVSILLLCDLSLRLRLLARWGLAGAFCGLAIATKYTVAPLMIVPCILGLSLPRPSRRSAILTFLFSAGGAFLLVEPYLVIAWPQVVDSFERIRGLHFAGGSVRSAAPRFLGDYLPLGLGALLLGGMLPAMVMAWYAEDVRLKAIIAYLGIIGAVFMWTTSGMPRYVITLAPLMCVILAGEICRWHILPVHRATVVLSLALILTWPANVVALKFMTLLSRPDTRHQALEWIEANVPTGRTVQLEGTISGEPTFAPALVPGGDWFEARLAEARAVGGSGQLLQAAAADATKRGRPRYRRVDKSVEDVIDFNGVDYVVLSEHRSLPHEFFRIVTSDDPDVQPLLQSRRTAIHRVQEEFSEAYAVEPVPNLRFDWFDNPDYWGLWSAPLEEYKQWQLGPIIKVYRRRATGPNRQVSDGRLPTSLTFMPTYRTV